MAHEALPFTSAGGLIKAWNLGSALPHAARAVAGHAMTPYGWLSCMDTNWG